MSSGVFCLGTCSLYFGHCMLLAGGDVSSLYRQHGALTHYVQTLCLYISSVHVKSNLHLWPQ